MKLQSLYAMPPAKREQASVPTFLQSTCHIGYRDAYTDDLMVGCVPVFYQTEHVHIKHGKPHLQVLVNLALRHLRITIKMTKRLVDYIKHLSAVLFLAEYLTALRVHGVQIIPFHHQFSHLAELVRHTFLGYNKLVFHIVVVLLPATQLLHVTGVVGIIIDGGHRAQFLEALDQHAFRIHIREAQRPNHLRHAFRASPVCNSIK